MSLGTGDVSSHIVFQDVEKTDWGWNGKLASD